MTQEPQCTIIVLAKDEEQRIGPTLEAATATGWPVLVVDSGSRDGTVALAEAKGATVVFHEFEDFASQHNWALGKVATPYVLFVDADERVVPELTAELRDAIASRVDAAWVPTMDYFAGRWMTAGGWYPQPHLRLLRVGPARYEGGVHERVVLDLSAPSVRHVTVPLFHFSHLTVSHYLRKLDQYTELEAAKVDGRPLVLVGRGTAEAVAVIVRRMLVQRGWRDGLHGWVGAVLYATYRFTIYAKAATRIAGSAPSLEEGVRVWRRRRRVPPISPPGS